MGIWSESRKRYSANRKKCQGGFLKKIKVEDNPEKIKELEKINEKIKQRVLQDSKEIRDFYGLIEKELARIRKEKK
jgi:hypothetical protein